MREAIGSDTARCDIGMDTLCRSNLIKDLFYAVNDTRCSEEDKITHESDNGQYHIAVCMTVDWLVKAGR